MCMGGKQPNMWLYLPLLSCDYWGCKSIGCILLERMAWPCAHRHKLNENADSSYKDIVFTVRGIHCDKAAEILHNLGNWTLVSFPCANYSLWSVLRQRSLSSDVNQRWVGFSPLVTSAGVYRTLKTASVNAKSSCSIKAASLVVSLSRCATVAPFSSHKLVGSARNPAPVPLKHLAMPKWS